MDGRLAGRAQQLLDSHRTRFVETVLGQLDTYVSSDAWITAFQSCCLWTGKDLGLGLGEGKVKGCCKDLFS